GGGTAAVRGRRFQGYGAAGAGKGRGALTRTRRRQLINGTPATRGRNMQGPLGEVFFLLIRTLGGVLLFAILARFLLQAARADFYNPVTQSLVKLTNPVLAPFHKVIPGFRGLDFSALVAALLLNSL